MRRDSCENPTAPDDTPRCFWTPSDDVDFDCAQIWPSSSPTAAPAPGCCKALSFGAVDRCGEQDNVDDCDRRSSCTWVQTDDDSECEFETTTGEPVDPGCCTIGFMGGDAYGFWGNLCKEFASEEDCVGPTMDDGTARCLWTDTEADFDCSTIWPTTSTAGPGCCASTMPRHYETCIAFDGEDDCDRRPNCHWIAGEEEDLCEHPSTTDSVEEDPGCCFVVDYSLMGTKWENKCKRFFTKTECLMAMHEDGDSLCNWEYTTDDEPDCSVYWPTPAPVTQEPGCCASDTAMAYDRCIVVMDSARCDNKASCHWESGVDADCEWPSTTETTYEPGCCYMSSNQNPEMGWIERCNDYWNEDQCLRPMNADGENRCEWQSTPPGANCEDIYPSPQPTEEQTPWPTHPPPAPGCCASDSPMTYDRCIIVTQEDRCTNKASCHWEVGTMDVCEWPSTTPTVFEPGCCVMDDSQNPRWQETCADFWNEDLCMRPMDDSDQNRCRWIPTGEDEDCEDYAPTPQPTDAQTPWPTTAPEVGCCKGYSVGTNVFCNGVDSKNACDKAGVCDWISNGVIDVDCTVPTEPPYIWPTPSPAEDPTEGEPGCCTGNSPRTWAYCETVDTEHRCDMAEECSWLSGPVDAPECVAPIPTPWPTRAPVLPPSKPTYDPNGCCAGTEYDADSWEFCEQFDDDAAACERRGICSWKVGDDEFCESDSNSTWPTPPPADWPTHSGAGCCYGAVPYNAYCFGKDNERKCDRSPDCEWRETDDATECLEETPAPVMPTKWPTTTPGSLDSSEEDEGCCKGYSAQTNNFCNGIDNAGACRHAGVCDWINGGTLEDDCTVETDPPAEWPTPPPAEIPTEAGPGCCTGNSPRTWAYCETVDEQVRCERAHECSWISGPVDAPECVSPTMEPTDEPTPWPTANPTTFVAGCCFGDSPKSNAFCAEMDDDRSGCRKSNRCDWIETDDSDECRLTEPPAPTYPSGCCAGHTPQSWTFCTQIDDAADCISKGQCDWLLTDDPADEVCSPPTPWPTPIPSTPLPGCCSSDGPSTFERCFAIDNNDQCTRRSSCHWVETEDPTECHVPSTTTAPGCCYIAPEQDAGSIWFDNCIAFYTEGECTRPSDKMGRERCFWTETEEDELCSDLFTTASPTP